MPRFNGAALIEARKRAGWIGTWEGPRCFNGAALIEARKHGRPESRIQRWRRLQWGRAHRSAETTARSLAPNGREIGFNGAALTEARKRGEYNPDGAQKRRASMGPRSQKRGNVDNPVLVTTSSLLQWGRAHRSAETPPSS